MKKRGFTLIEILVAATIIAVLSMVAVTSYGSINKRSRDAKRKSDLEQIRSALEMYRADNGTYPKVCGWASRDIKLPTYLVPNYMSAVPKDPKISDPTAWNYLVGPGNYFGYMYAGDACPTPANGYTYALWAQLESPSAADTATLGQGSITTYNTGYGMNYKVVNP
jgi:general secretion pathway protein G